MISKSCSCFFLPAFENHMGWHPLRGGLLLCACRVHSLSPPSCVCVVSGCRFDTGTLTVHLLMKPQCQYFEARTAASRVGSSHCVLAYTCQYLISLILWPIKQLE